MPDIPTEALEAEEAASAAAAEEVWNIAYAAGLAAGEKRGRAEAAADIAAKLRRGAAGRREYAEPTSPAVEILNQEAAVLDSAALVAGGDLTPMFGWMPSWRWTQEMQDWLAAEGSGDREAARVAEEGDTPDA